MYKYSLWLVLTPPKKLSDLLRRYNTIPHVPHVTIETNIETFDEAMRKRRHMPLLDTVSVDGVSQMFASHYDNDPLHAWGFVVSLTNNKTDHEPHLTIKYSLEELKHFPEEYLRFTTDAHLEVATCHSSKPNEWMVLTQQLY